MKLLKNIYKCMDEITNEVLMIRFEVEELISVEML